MPLYYPVSSSDENALGMFHSYIVSGVSVVGTSTSSSSSITYASSYQTIDIATAFSSSEVVPTNDGYSGLQTTLYDGDTVATSLTSADFEVGTVIESYYGNPSAHTELRNHTIVEPLSGTDVIGNYVATTSSGVVTSNRVTYFLEAIVIDDASNLSEGVLVNGTAGDDTLKGGTGDDTINGLAGDDRLEGYAGNDVLNGGTGEDSLYGGAGDDKLDGGTGNDTLVGEAGNDTYVIDAAADAVTEAASGGTDTVIASIAYTLGSQVENLTLTGILVINGSGNELANRLTGNAAANALSGLLGNDTLSGGGGNDYLDGGAGNDRLEGGLGNDVLVVDAAGDVVVELANGGIDQVNGLRCKL